MNSMVMLLLYLIDVNCPIIAPDSAKDHCGTTPLFRGGLIVPIKKIEMILHKSATSAVLFSVQSVSKILPLLFDRAHL